MIKMSRDKMRKFSVLGIKNHRSAAVGGGGRRVRPPGSASVDLKGHIYIIILDAFTIKLVFNKLHLFSHYYNDLSVATAQQQPKT